MGSVFRAMRWFWKIGLPVAAFSVYVGYQLTSRSDPVDFNNKRVFVTGASKGIGEQIAYNYAKLGAHVVVVARNEEKLKKVVEHCKTLAPANRNYDYIVADLGETLKLPTIIQKAIGKLGGLDYLVLNHVLQEPVTWRGTSENLQSLHRTFNLNFFSYVHLASHALTELEKSAGSIIVVGSVIGKVASPTFAAYSAEKSALDGFFSAWRQELAMQNSNASITYCVVGLIGTDSAKNMMANKLGNKHGMLKYADPSETAYDIIQGGARRLREVYTPYGTRYMVVFKEFIISWLEPWLQRVHTSV